MGKGRPKFSRCGAFTRTYTPEKTANYETLVKWYYEQESHGQALQGPIKANITAYFPIPKSATKKLTAQMETETVPYQHKADWDNCGKIICDALNALAYADDAQIVDGRVRKFYGRVPRVVVKLTEL